MPQEYKLGQLNVVNKYHAIPYYQHDGLYDICIMRGYPLGNPFAISDKLTRETVILNYQKYITDEIAKDNQLIIDALNDISYKIMQGHDINLICCCKPKACHGDIIKSGIESAIKEHLWMPF